VWYLFPAHNSRTLVERVDFRSGPPPRAGRVRRLLTPLGRFQLRPERGWFALALTPGTEVADVADNTGFEIEIDAGVAEVPGPTAGEMAAFEAVDPLRLRDLDFLSPNEAAGRIAEMTAEDIQPPVRD
jgi:hypothetical protein